MVMIISVLPQCKPLWESKRVGDIVPTHYCMRRLAYEATEVSVAQGCDWCWRRCRRRCWLADQAAARERTSTSPRVEVDPAIIGRPNSKIDLQMAADEMGGPG